MSDTVEFYELCGEHLLDAVDTSNEQVKTWGDEFENCEVLRFRLDGKVYTATEDPSDGYRSSMRTFEVSESPMKNTFEPIRVLARHRTEGSYGCSDDVLELLDIKTARVILEVGTHNTHDYYPSFVASFNPGNMSINSD